MSSKTKSSFKGQVKSSASTRRFAYQSFSQKIASLKIDPVRRVRRYVDDEETTESFFHTAYEKWIELNLTTTFTTFAKEVGPLSESLPLIVHHKDRIFELLYSYIDKRDALSLEPLLDLLAQFAHDLGVEFEPYLGRSVSLLSSLVMKHIDFTTIEWTFNCLAYLLKYLSRLLVSDLRPIYNVLAPLLGKENQKPFVVRFAAEALSFLIRKAKGESLQLIVRHMLEDLTASKENPKAWDYTMGVTSTLHEACISVDRTIHSRGTAVFQALMQVATEKEEVEESTCEVVEGVLVAIIHHTNEETFKPIQDCILEFVEERTKKDTPNPSHLEFYALLLDVAVTVRKGSRITRWSDFADCALKVLELATKPDDADNRDAVWAGLKCMNAIMQYAGFDIAISKCGRVAEKAKEWNQGALFLSFCDLVMEIGQERFSQFVLSTLQQFMLTSWDRYEKQLCVLIPKLHAKGAFEQHKDKTTIDLLRPNSPIFSAAIKAFEKLKAASNGSDRQSETAEAWAYLNVFSCLPSQAGSEASKIMERSLENLLDDISSHSEQQRLAPLAGKALGILATVGKSVVSSSQLITLTAAFARNPVFLRGVCNYIKKCKPELSEEQREALSDSYVDNLASSRHEVRRASMSLLEILLSPPDAKFPEPSDTLRTITLLEDTPFIIPNQRNLSMYVRKLGSEYGRLSPKSLERRMVPIYMFGLTTVKFAPLWEDASKALAQIVEFEETLVADYAFKWLSGEGLSDYEDPADVADPAKPSLTPFQCSNLLVVDQAAEKCIEDEENAPEQIFQSLEEACIPGLVPAAKARSQALLILTEIPKVAEKRSRVIVPMFLEWAKLGNTGAEDDEEEGEVEGTESDKRKWSRRDRSAMLKLFSHFVNPRVLFSAEEVHECLLHLLESGDGKVQSLALKCILTWKNPAVKPYEDRLNNLLDDTMFRDELTNFVQVEAEESPIQNQHRAELMPVLLRLLYGRSLSRKNASSGKKGMSSSRIAILTSVANFNNDEKAMFLNIALGNLADTKFVDKSDPKEYKFNHNGLGEAHVSTRKQIGLVRMLEDILKHFGSTLQPLLTPMVDAILHLLVGSVKFTNNRNADDDDDIAAKAYKSVRIGGYKCLNAMFHYCPNFNWKPYMPAIFNTLINPRLEKLPIETSQSVSAHLQLFSTWASSHYTVLFLADYNADVVPKLAECLTNESVKDEVVLFIIQVLRKIVQHTSSIDEAAEEVADAVKFRLLTKNIDLLLASISHNLQKSLQKEVLEQCIEAVASLAVFVSSTTETTKLVQICVFLLNQPSRRVNPKIKSDILRILVNVIPNCVMEKGDELYDSVYKTVSSLFGFFKDRISRENLAVVLDVFAARDQEVKEVAELSIALNSFSKKRVDEPDFDRRLAAFATINEDRFKAFNGKQWLPILYNMFYYIKDNEELALRTNASYALRRFSECCADDSTSELSQLLVSVVLPVLRNGAHEQSEIVRVEYISVMAHTIKLCTSLEDVHDMTPLLMGGDEEADFFNNVLHIQQHRRLRALRRLALIAKSHQLQSQNISQFLLPLIEHFVFDMEKDAHNLANEAVRTVGTLAEQLTWTQYRALGKRYLGFIKTKPTLVKVVIRLLGAVVDALVAATGGENVEEDEETGQEEEKTEQTENADVEMTDSPQKFTPRLKETLPAPDKLATDISATFLPTMTSYLHEKDESTVSLRVPVAISIVKLLRVMPDEVMRRKLPGTLMDISHILRSRAQDDRDMTRKTLAQIAMLLGPQYFSFIIKELKGSLQRGYQLHVLSYTVHSILVVVVPKFPVGSLDYCASTIVDIIMDDIFGVTGSEKDAADYISKMKEVKSSKSYDSMDILASITTLPYLGGLIRPIRSLLMEKLTAKILQKVDELLRRITVGLLRNGNVKDQSLLVFCYEIIQEVYKAQNQKPQEKIEDEKRKKFLVNLKAPSKVESSVKTNSGVFKLTKFALDILRTILGKHEEMQTPENLANFIPIIGDAILSNTEEVQISALRLLTAIIRTPLKDIDSGAPVFVDKALSFVKSSPSTNAEIAQASLKFVAAILRERRNVKVKDTTVAYLLNRIKPDLEEPHLQGVTFNFLKATLLRRIQIPEVYDVMDAVSAIMITNQTRSVRDECRRLYFQFLMDYPQSKDRWKKQQAFMVQNLSFKHESGRLSVLDVMHLVVTKMGDNIIQDILDTFFAPLVVALVNDESQQCREMAGEVTKDLFRRTDEEHTQKFLGMLWKWVSADQKPQVNLMALQVYGLYFDVASVDAKSEVNALTKRLQEIVGTATNVDDGNEDANQSEWEGIYRSLQVWRRLITAFPDLTLAGSCADMWKGVRACLRYPHAWIRSTSSQLLGVLFADFARNGALDALPLSNGKGLEVDADDLINITWAISSQLNSPELTEELGQQVAKNLMFLAKVFYATKMPVTEAVPTSEQLDDIEEEQGKKSALEWLMSRMSGVVRSERNIKRGLIGKKYSLAWFASLISSVLTPEDLIPLSQSIIVPLYNLTELPEGHTMNELKNTALEILSLLQKKIGTTEYTKAYSAVKMAVAEKRQQRRMKRKIAAVAEPELEARRKEKKHDREKRRRKEKGREEREKRMLRKAL